MRGGIALLSVLLWVAGCTTRPPGHDDARRGDVAYWLAAPATASVTGDEYRALWDAAVDACRRFGFDVTLSDYRDGLILTLPREGGTLFEPWRDEQRSLADALESTATLTRRSVEFRFTRDFTRDGDLFRVTPRVVVERDARRIGPVRRAADEPAARFGWYADGRDVRLERSLANRIARRTGATHVDDPQAAAALAR